MKVRRKSIHLTMTFFFIFLLFSPIYTQNLFPAAFGGSYRFNITLLTPHFNSYSIGDTPELWGQIINVGTNPLDDYTLIAEFTVIAPSGENIPAGSGANYVPIASSGAYVFENFDGPWTIPSDAESGPYDIRVIISSGTYRISEMETVYDAFSVAPPPNHPPSASKISPLDDTVNIDVGNSLTFNVALSDVDGNLHHVDWFLDGPNTDTTMVSGSSDTDSWTHTFTEPGTVVATVFDEELEQDSVSWTILVNPFLTSWMLYPPFYGVNHDYGELIGVGRNEHISSINGNQGYGQGGSIAAGGPLGGHAYSWSNFSLFEYWTSPNDGDYQFIWDSYVDIITVNKGASSISPVHGSGCKVWIVFGILDLQGTDIHRKEFILYEDQKPKGIIDAVLDAAVELILEKAFEYITGIAGVSNLIPKLYGFKTNTFAADLTYDTVVTLEKGHLYIPYMNVYTWTIGLGTVESWGLAKAESYAELRTIEINSLDEQYYPIDIIARNSETNEVLSGSNVYVDQKFVGTTDVNGRIDLNLVEGTYQIKLVKDYYNDQTGQVIAGVNAEKTFYLEPYQSLIVELLTPQNNSINEQSIQFNVQVISNDSPLDDVIVSIFLNDENIGSETTNINGLATKSSSLQDGEYIWYVRVEKDGYLPAFSEIFFFEVKSSFSLTVQVSGSGNTDPPPGVYECNEGEEVLVDAIPDFGLMFDHWELGETDIGFDNPITVTMDNDYTLTAVFTYKFAIIESEKILIVVPEEYILLHEPHLLRIEEEYQALLGLVGTAPFNGEKISIEYNPEIESATAYAGNPIRIGKGFWGEMLTVVTHELGHDFTRYPEFPQSIIIPYGAFLEGWAQFLKSYCHLTVYPNYFSNVFTWENYDYYAASYISIELDGTEVPTTAHVPTFETFRDKYLLTSLQEYLDNGANPTELKPNAVAGMLTKIVELYGWESITNFFNLVKTKNDLPSSTSNEEKMGCFITYMNEAVDQDLTTLFLSWGLISDTEIPVPQYQLNIQVSGSGMTNPAPGTTMYDEGTGVSINAIPDSGWTLDHWEMDGINVGSESPINVTMDNDHILKAVFTPIPTFLSLKITSSSAYIGFITKIDGKLTYENGSGISGTNILLESSVTGGSTWSAITSTETEADGSFSVEWMPTATGNYIVRASASETPSLGESRDQINLAILPFEDEYVFSVISNSTITNLDFSSTRKELSFTVEGPPNTLGYTNATIAKTLIENIEEFQVTIDGSELNYIVKSIGNSWIVHFTYHHSIHTIVLSLTQPLNKPPVADANGPYSSTQGEPIIFNGAKSDDPDGPISSYIWDFGDGNTGTGVTTSHTYANDGAYIVTLTVTDNPGAENSAITTATVIAPPPPPFPTPPPPPPPPPLPPPTNKAPVADAGPDRTVYVEVPIHFSGAGSQDPEGNIAEYHWFFGDRGHDSGVKVMHVYEEAGTYTVSLAVIDSNGATGTDSCIITVESPPANVSDDASEEIPANKTSYVLDALDVANTTVTVNTTDTVTVTVIKYESNPHPEDPMPDTGIPKYADIFISDPDAVDWPIYVEMFYTDEDVEGLDEYSLGIYYWFNGTWQRCSDTGVDTENNVVWTYMTAEEASGSPILMGGMPAMPVPPLPPILSNLTITPDEAERGDNVTINLDIENIDSQSFTYIVTTKIENVNDPPPTWPPYNITLTVYVELEAYESKTVSQTITLDTVGDFNVTIIGLTGSFTVGTWPPEPPPSPAEFEVSDLSITPDKVELGEDVIISFTVTNIGEQTGSYIVDLKIDGVPTAGRMGELEPGESEAGLYELTPETLGDHSVEVDGLTGSFTVDAPPKPAEFDFSNLRIFYPGVIPPEVERGQTVTVTVSIDVANVGEEVGSYTVELVLNGAVVGSEEITPLGGGMTITVLFEENWSAGTYQINVEDLTETFTVSEKPIIPFWMRPGTIAGIIIIILAVAAILYDNRRRYSLPSTPRSTTRSNSHDALAVEVGSALPLEMFFSG